MNFLVIATHHGAFLTLESVFEKMRADDKVYVVVPQSQIDKYSGMDEAVFQNYTKMLYEYVNGRTDIYAVEFDSKNAVISSTEIASVIGIEGPTLVLPAGSILNSRDAIPDIGDKLMLFSPARTFRGRFDMYSELGIPSVSSSSNYYNMIFMVDPSAFSDAYRGSKVSFIQDHMLFATLNAKQQLAIVDPSVFTRNDPLIGNALSTVEALRYGSRALKAAAWYYWGVSMKDPDKTMHDEYYAYPMHVYSEYAKKVKNYLPTGTLDRIIENGKESEGAAQKLRELEV